MSNARLFAVAAVVVTLTGATPTLCAETPTEADFSACNGDGAESSGGGRAVDRFTGENHHRSL